jgi:hypothetical protein
MNRAQRRAALQRQQAPVPPQVPVQVQTSAPRQEESLLQSPGGALLLQITARLVKRIHGDKLENHLSISVEGPAQDVDVAMEMLAATRARIQMEMRRNLARKALSHLRERQPPT